MIYIRQPYPNELYHHGIKGQKWGVRRYQNPDGSLTAAGKERYRKFNIKDIEDTLHKVKISDINKNLEERKAAIDSDTRFYKHITTTPDFKLGNSDRLFVFSEPDSPSYAGIMAARQRMRKRSVYEVALELSKSPNVAGREQQEKILHSVLKTLNESEKYDLDNKVKTFWDNFGNYEDTVSKLDNQAYFEALPYIMDKNGNHHKVWNNFIKQAKKEGYDTLLDLNDEIGNPNTAVASIRPLILLDPDSQIMNYSVKELSDTDIVQELRKML